MNDFSLVISGGVGPVVGVGGLTLLLMLLLPPPAPAAFAASLSAGGGACGAPAAPVDFPGRGSLASEDLWVRFVLLPVAKLELAVLIARSVS